MVLQLSATELAPGLLDLPWAAPLEEWPRERLAALPRGISRHVVRFVRLPGGVVAVKEIDGRLAAREYATLQTLTRMGHPAVEPLAVVSGRVDPAGEELPAALVTRHLRFSLPYRAVFSRTLAPGEARALSGALVALLVRLHTSGVFWGDVSLSNTLFRRDAGAFQAYLVDAETAEVHPRLSEGQRLYDVDIAHDNIAGELMDLAAAELLDPGVDPVQIADDLVLRYESLWAELTGREPLDASERWRVDERIRRLNALGYDVGEMAVAADGGQLTIEPLVVQAGHHGRRLESLTGLHVGENQARRLLADLASYRAAVGLENVDERTAALQWLRAHWDPIEAMVPDEMQAKLPPAELFHEVLEHRWYLGERAGHDIAFTDVIRDYVATVLPSKPDEVAVLGVDTQDMPIRATLDPGAGPGPAS